MTKTQLVQLLKDNLADSRIYPIRLFLEDLVERKVILDGVEKYRMYTLTPSLVPGEEPTRTYITSIEGFLASITEEGITPGYPYFTYKPHSNMTTPLSVDVTNIHVEISHYTEEDNKYVQMWGSKITKHVNFILAYTNDNDTTLPLKIVNVILR